MDQHTSHSPDAGEVPQAGDYAGEDSIPQDDGTDNDWQLEPLKDGDAEPAP